MTVPTLGEIVTVLATDLGDPSGLTTLVDVPGERRVLGGHVDGRPVIVKAYHQPVAEAMFQRQAMLAAAAGDCDVLRVPEPLLASGRVLVLERLEGTPYTELAGQTQVAAALHRAGVALAELHRIDVSADDRAAARTMADHLRELVNPHPTRLGAVFPQWAPLVEATLLSLAATDPSPAAPTALLHRDMHLRQLIDLGPRVGIVDWDLAAAGDPVFDVGYLTTYLETHTASPAALTDAFLDGYATLRDRPTSQHLRPYRCFNLLRRACRRFRVRDAGWHAEMDRMLCLLDVAVSESVARP
ncbi:MAG: hypothetical protein QOI54_3567 [Actinomycetota bacterium]|jgi:aminoglycoside phosphotransferase (APT) family kinase protein|nr:hypothetical protein [Actinomycetota bacterium]